MATIRISPNDMQVGETVYVFATVEEADAFEECIAATGDAKDCAARNPPHSIQPADTRSQDMTP